MKIGKRNITSFSNFMEQFQQYALDRPWLAAADVALACAVVYVMLKVIL